MRLQNVRYLPNLLQNRLHTLPLLVLYLTDGCNSRCAMCDIWQAPRRNMDMALVDELVLDATRLNTEMVLLSGGEAMQHPEWPEIARRFRAAGIQVWLLTNGLLLKKQAAEVIATLDRVTVSLDAATPERYQQIRGVDALQLVLDGMQHISEHIPVSTRTTVMRANFRQMPQLVDVALAHGASSVSFLAVDTVNPYAFGPRFEHDGAIPLAGSTPTAPVADDFGGLVVDDLAEFAALLDSLFESHADHFTDGRIEESPAKLRRLYNFFAAPYGKATFAPPRCNAPHISVVVNVDGSLQPCYFLAGNNDSRGLKGLNSDHMQQMRAAYQKGATPECERCVCPLYRGPRSLLRGL
jgi:Fe-coproporphyrin III synthase